MFFYVLVFLFGLCFGSFASMICYRVPRKKSLIKRSSNCPFCEKTILPRDLIPLVSWILLKTRCRYCKEPISLRYPFTEFFCSILFLLIAVYSGINGSIIFLSLFVFTLMCVSIIDYDTQEIPDSLLIFALVVGVFWVVLSSFLPDMFLYAPSISGAFFGMLAGGLPLFILDLLVLFFVKKDGFGYGDVKLMAVAGVFLGYRMILVSFFFAFFVANLVVCVLLVTKKVRRNEYIAFGPFLCIGILMTFWLGDWFLRLMGI